MKIKKPKFTLNAPCPICEQGSSLVFLTCPSCGTVIIACDEEGSVFPDPQDLSQTANYSCDPWISTTTHCLQCDATREFRFSSGEEIQNLGFSAADYS